MRQAQAWRDERLEQLGAHLAGARSLLGARASVYLAFDTPPTALWDALAQQQVIGLLAGVWDARPGGPLGFASELDPFELPPDDAIDFWRRRKVVTAPEYLQLSRNAQADSFYVAGVVDRRLMDRIHGAIDRSLAEGTGLADFVESVDAATAEAGSAPFGLHRLRTVFDTNLASAYSAGRYRQLMEAKEGRPFWRYNAIDDDRTRPAHAAMDGKVARHDDPVWTQWFPPNGFLCRCNVTSLSADEVGDADQDLPEVNPDKGFDRSPALEQEARDVGDGIAQQTTSLGLLPSTQMDRQRLQAAEAGQITQQHQAAMNALARSRDPQRLAQLQRVTGFQGEQVAELLQQSNALNLYPPGWTPDPKELVAEMHMYSQDAASTVAVARRLVHHPRWAKLRAKLEVQPKVTLFRSWDPDWDSATQAFDVQLARKLGDKTPVAWSSEASLRITLGEPSAAAAAELAELGEWLQEQVEPGDGRNAVALAWEIGDVRLLGPGSGAARSAAPTPTGAQMDTVWLYTQELKSGWTVAFLSAVPGGPWESREVAVSSPLAQILPRPKATP